MFWKDARKNIAIYDSIDGYVEAVSENASPNIELENVQTIFICFAFFLVLLSFVYVMHLLLVILLIIYCKLSNSSAIVQLMNLRNSPFPRLAIEPADSDSGP